MKDTLAYAIEVAIKQIAKQNLSAAEYERFVADIRKTKTIRVGPDHRTLHDLIVGHAIEIADWATGNRYSEVSHHVENKKQQAIQNIKNIFGW